MRRLLYSAWYLFKPPWDTGIPAPELVRAVAQRPPGRALDLGCGTGTNVRYLAERGWRATGLDFIPRAIARARRRCAGLPVTLLVADVTQLETLALAGLFDLALDMGCFHSLDEAGHRAYAAGLRRWMNPGGIFLLYAWLSKTPLNLPLPRQTPPGQFTPSEGGERGDTRGVGGPRRAGLSREAVIAAFEGFRLTGFELGQGRPSAWYYFERLANG